MGFLYLCNEPFVNVLTHEGEDLTEKEESD